jgi:hypothetical protein
MKITKKNAYHAKHAVERDMKMNGTLETNARKNSRPRKVNYFLEKISEFRTSACI